jgi:signal transduction histidine kinase
VPEQATAIAAPPPRVVHLPAAPPGWDDSAPIERRQARERRVARDLIELSRLQRGGEQARFAPLDLAAMLRAICADYRPPLRIDGPRELAVNTDSRRLARVLLVLLDNAYVHGAPPVSVSYNATEIIIQDGGPGLAPTLLQRATEPFVTGHRGHGRGVGLGLAIAARQAALLGAQLELSNALPIGAVARLRFAADPSSHAGP